MQNHDKDEFYMERAIELALKGTGKVNPNPLVGAVIVKEGKIIGEGFHEKYGCAHAERNAINHASENVEGSTLYVTLEPCHHYGKTPPCVDYVIEKKIKRVVIGMKDPNPLVAGKSIEKLKKCGIEVIEGIKEKECIKMNEVFIKYITTKIPYVTAKSGMSLDGKIAASTGESQWITCSESRKHSHELRNKLSSIMVGINTVIADNPSLTYRGEYEGRNPVRIIVDSSLKIPLNAKVVNDGEAETIIVCTKNADESKKQKLKDLKAEIIETEEEEGKVDLKEMMKKLGERGIDSVLLEGGGTLNYSMFKNNLVDKVRMYIAPKIIGGSKNAVSGEGFEKLSECTELYDLTWQQSGSDLMIEGYVRKEV